MEFDDRDVLRPNDFERAQEIMNGDHQSVELPPDIAGVWGSSSKARHIATEMIQRWGLENFRESKLHRIAQLDQERQHSLDERRKSYLKKQK